ncbi:MAG TPA: hypothetical protein DFR83_03300 [Deltaproteobacteria bacterium]|nr:hypothetical protein [Deltaproteobacteria bacterium]
MFQLHAVTGRVCLPLLSVAVLSCAEVREKPSDTTDWWGAGEDAWVEEAIDFTTDAYGIPADATAGIGDFAEQVFPVGDWDAGTDLWAIKYAPGEGFPEGCGSQEDDALPYELDGIVTLHPAWYIKSYGCAVDPDQSWTPDSEEKYYSSYFIEDDSGGLFVLFDSRVAPFTVGDRVRLKVRAVRSNHWNNRGDYIGSQNMIYAQDIVSVERSVSAIHYTDVDGELGIEHVNRVVRVTGTIVDIDESFNNYTIETASGAEVIYSLGLDLGRRPSSKAELGDTVTATGPVLLSYSTFTISIAQVGQLDIASTD